MILNTFNWLPKSFRKAVQIDDSYIDPPQKQEAPQ